MQRTPDGSTRVRTLGRDPEADYGKVYGRPGRRFPRLPLPPGSLILPLIVAIVASIVAVIEYVPFPGVPTLSESPPSADVRVVRDMAPEPINAAPLPAEPLEADAADAPAQAVLSSGPVPAETDEEETTQPGTTEPRTGEADGPPVGGAALGSNPASLEESED